MLLCLIANELADPSLDALIEAVHRCTPLISVPCRGRIFCGTDDLTGLHGLVERENIRAAMAPERSTALLQALQSRPGRIDIHEHADTVSTDVLARLDELGITTDDVERLRMFGLNTIASVRRLERRHLQVQFGYRGDALFRLLHRADHSPLPMYVPPPEVICSERFETDQREPGPIMDAAQRVTTKAIDLLAGRQAWRIEVGIMNAADIVSTAQSRILRQGSSLLRTLLTHVHTLCRHLLQARQIWRGLRLRLASLRHPEGEQISLFDSGNNRSDVVELLRPRYAGVVKRIEILDPWSILPERYSRIVPIGPAIPPEQEALP